MSIVLGLFEGQMLLLAAAILVRHVRRADRTLGALLVVLCGMLTPFAIGYAGFYDRWPWLSFAPFAVPLAMGPLLYAHLNALVLDRPISRWHAALPVVQFAYQAAVFCLPLDLRGVFDREIQRPWLDPLLAVLLLGSMIGYAVAGWRLVKRHRAWLRARRTDLAAADRVRGVLVAFAVIVALRTAYTIVDTFIVPLSYFDMFGFYVALALIGNYLAIEGWRQSGARLQPIVEPPPRDWPGIARDWVGRIEEHKWWRDPGLDLAGLARRLGTNTAYLSRGLNEGLGVGFADAINRLRVDHAAERLRGSSDDDILAIALDAGFGSKATFNRVFKERFGMTPSAYRRVSNSKNDVGDPDLQRTA
ncbi:AraC family transcriptional regulator [Glacieibacterium megasporae]|uniref:AraC family transcriptional regulator n=1 Tax=Glacieibacterium megasporae TaxID=2835787 RepID=UPI001C1E20B5|nr:helix-turn-helix domain-containing protein [Polymorphobacter megasporae]UAJ11450.1 helix-turn-helix domain-containing protein [Polymorphobacter megasporae]